MKNLCVLILIAGLCHSGSKASLCTTRGRFPSDDTEDCGGYTMCLSGLTNFTQYKLTCPQGFIYSHLEQQCTNATDYQCWPSYNCLTIGNYADNSSKNCTSFIACIEGINELVTARWIQCPPNMVFSPIAGNCVNKTEYRCPASEIKEPDVVKDVFVLTGTDTRVSNNAVALSIKIVVLFFVLAIIAL